MQIYINVDVVNQTLKVVRYFDQEVVEGSNNFVQFKFHFLDGDWDPLTKFAQFVNYERAYNVYLDSNDCAYLPKQIVTGTCYLILCGTSNNAVATTDALKFKVKENNLVQDINSVDITDSLYNQMVALV